jgi:hypothetical protein
VVDCADLNGPLVKRYVRSPKDTYDLIKRYKVSKIRSSQRYGEEKIQYCMSFKNTIFSKDIAYVRWSKDMSSKSYFPIFSKDTVRYVRSSQKIWSVKDTISSKDTDAKRDSISYKRYDLLKRYCVRTMVKRWYSVEVQKILSDLRKRYCSMSKDMIVKRYCVQYVMCDLQNIRSVRSFKRYLQFKDTAVWSSKDTSYTTVRSSQKIQ